MMKIQCVAADSLTALQRQRWRDLQDREPSLDSPFFCVEWVEAVARVRESIDVAVVQQDGIPVGFVPFYRDPDNTARAVAGTFTDLEGMVSSSQLPVDPHQLLQSCGLSGWYFENLLVSQAAFRDFHLTAHRSAYMDLSGGFEAYREERRQAGSDELREAMRKARKLEREVGPLRFEPFTTDPHVFQSLLRWKRAQLMHWGAPDCFAAPWVVPLLRQVVETRGNRFAGMLSAVFAGDRLVAVSLGIRFRKVLHGWVMAYNREFRKYSPGLVLLFKLAESAETMGICRVDMGGGRESFKESFASGSVPLAGGSIDRRLVRSFVHRSWIRSKEIVRGTLLDRPARRLVDHVRNAISQ